MKIFKLMMIFGVLLICATPAFADDGPTLPDDPENVPIDGGISLLVAAGIGYGAKKMRDKKANIASADKN